MRGMEEEETPLYTPADLRIIFVRIGVEMEV
jgi:hypothetical protein